jgi:hypothetical protein
MGLLTIVEQRKGHACEQLPGATRARALISYAVRILETVRQP